jgi:hypothetical protein
VPPILQRLKNPPKQNNSSSFFNRQRGAVPLTFLFRFPRITSHLRRSGKQVEYTFTPSLCVGQMTYGTAMSILT